MMRRLIKQVIYGSVFLFFIAAVIFGIYWFVLRSPETCFDNKQNGKEEKVDCGGDCISCELKYPADFETGSFQIISAGKGQTVIAVSITNPNLNFGAPEFTYNIRAIGPGQEILKEISGKSFLYAAEANKNIVEVFDLDKSEIDSVDASFSDATFKSRDNFKRPNISIKQYATELYLPQEIKIPLFTFTRDLFEGLNGEDVRVLQEFLKIKGFLKSEPNGYFGKGTKTALIAYQKSKNFPTTGYFGSKTRQDINAQTEAAEKLIPEGGDVFPVTVTGMLKNDDVVNASKVILTAFIYDNRFSSLIGISKTEMENVQSSEERNFRIVFPKSINPSQVDKSRTRIFLDAIR